MDRSVPILLMKGSLFFLWPKIKRGWDYSTLMKIEKTDIVVNVDIKHSF